MQKDKIHLFYCVFASCYVTITDVGCKGLYGCTAGDEVISFRGKSPLVEQGRGGTVRYCCSYFYILISGWLLNHPHPYIFHTAEPHQGGIDPLCCDVPEGRPRNLEPRWPLGEHLQHLTLTSNTVKEMVLRVNCEYN